MDDTREGGDGPPVGHGKRLLRGVTVLLVVSALTLLALELAVGRFFPVGGQVYVIDDELLYDAAPGAARIQRMGEAYLREGDKARVHIKVGGDRFRGAALERPKRRRRILVIGDSLVMAENVPEDRTFVVRLGRELEARLDLDGGIETVNAGRSGYGPDQSLLLFERDEATVDPDLVVCVLCAHNDHGDLMRNKLFRLDDEGTLERLRPELGDRMRERFEAVARSSARPALERLWDFRQQGRRLPAKEEPLPAGTMRLYVTALEAQTREHVVDRNLEVVSLFEDIYDIDVAAGLDGPSVAAKRELMTGVLGRMTAFARERDVPLVFVVVPSAVDVCAEFGIRVDPVQFSTHSPTRLVESLVASVGLAGGAAIDVTPVLVQEGPADRYFVGGSDMHWNSRGQGVAASYVAEELLRDSGVVAAFEE